MEVLDITPSPRLLSVLGDIPLQPWQCLAELIDNSLDELSRFGTPTDGERRLKINIDFIADSVRGDRLRVEDNGFGMETAELERSLRAGHSGKARYGTLGLFGMGFNIATARLGNVTTVTTATKGMPTALRVVIDFASLQKTESFHVPLEEVEKPHAEWSGTIVEVGLKPGMASAFSTPRARTVINGQLGDVYSYLLREEIPGLTKSGLSSPIPAEIVFGETLVTPRLPCVWSDGRSVLSQGQEVEAIQYIDKTLTAATACMDCGYWDRMNGPEVCEECGSSNIEERTRKIRGWIGIQRYTDTTDFGVDFLRYGRKILLRDKTIFSYQDPDTLQTDIEYPIEMPANQGRIVGEIHLDHVQVTYQKNDFDRQSRDWQLALREIRGGSPLKPRSGAEANNSPLARLYSAYRRNDPGRRYLTPGDGKRALLAKAREWGGYFHKGLPEYLTDDVWFEYVTGHQAIKDGEGAEGGGGRSGGGDGGATNPGGGDSAPGAFSKYIGGADEPIAPTPPVDPKPRTRNEMLAAARLLGSERADISSTFALPNPLGSWELKVLTTTFALENEDGNKVASLVGDIRGNQIEVLVCSEHKSIREYGRDVRDVALIQAASTISALRGNALTTPEIYTLLVESVEDLRVNAALVIQRISDTLERLRGQMRPIVAEDPSGFWESLRIADKEFVEVASANAKPNTPFLEVVNSGDFVDFLSIDGVRHIILSRPKAFYDGKALKASLAHRPEDAQEAVVARFSRAMEELSSFAGDELLRQKTDLDLAVIFLDYLDDLVVSDELLQ